MIGEESLEQNSWACHPQPPLDNMPLKGGMILDEVDMNFALDPMTTQQEEEMTTAAPAE